MNFVFGDPLKRLIIARSRRVSLAPRFAGENVVARVEQEVAIRNARPALRAELQAEKDHALTRLFGFKVTAFENHAVGGRNVQMLGVVPRLAEWDHEERL